MTRTVNQCVTLRKSKMVSWDIPIKHGDFDGKIMENLKIPINEGLHGKTHRKVWGYMRHLIKHGGLNRNIIHRIYCYVRLPGGTSPTFLLVS